MNEEILFGESINFFFLNFLGLNIIFFTLSKFLFIYSFNKTFVSRHFLNRLFVINAEEIIYRNT